MQGAAKIKFEIFVDYSFSILLVLEALSNSLKDDFSLTAVSIQ